MSIELGNARLLQLADILENADEQHTERGEPTYSQSRYTHRCGTPACALGHWAAANPDRWAIEINSFVNPEIVYKPEPDLPLHLAAGDEFSLSIRGEVELFGRTGCGHATTAKQAAKYIREFVAKRQS